MEVSLALIAVGRYFATNLHRGNGQLGLDDIRQRERLASPEPYRSSCKKCDRGDR